MPLPEEPTSPVDPASSMQSQTALRNRKGVTAAQLYALNVIGTGSFFVNCHDLLETTQPRQEGPSEAEKEKQLNRVLLFLPFNIRPTSQQITTIESV